jgi:hypothetical protein
VVLRSIFGVSAMTHTAPHLLTGWLDTPPQVHIRSLNTSGIYFRGMSTTPGHDPIFVTVDIKSEAGSVEAFPAELDTYLSEWFNRNLIFKPSDLSSDLKHLVAASLKSKWPTVGQLAGKFIFHLTGNPDWKKYYADCMTKSSLCFAEFDVDPSKNFTELTLPLNRVVASLSLWDHWGDHDN